jgi:hypothetical protein
MKVRSATNEIILTPTMDPGLPTSPVGGRRDDILFMTFSEPEHSSSYTPEQFRTRAEPCHVPSGTWPCSGFSVYPV